MVFSSCVQSRRVWGTLAVARPGRLSSSRAGLSPVMAAEQFLPPGKLEIVSFVNHLQLAGLRQNKGRPLSRQSTRTF